MPSCGITHFNGLVERPCRRQPVYAYAGVHYCLPDLKAELKIDAEYAQENGLPAPPTVMQILKASQK